MNVEQRPFLVLYVTWIEPESTRNASILVAYDRMRRAAALVKNRVCGMIELPRETG